MDSPPFLPSSPDRPDFDDLGTAPTLPFPPGTYTLLPLVEKCDNLDLPSGPWSPIDWKLRWQKHCDDERARQKRANAVDLSAGDSSALADDDEDEDENAPSNFKHEFLAPFFLSFPTPSPLSAPSTPARRSSSVSGSRPSFSAFTPLSPPVAPAAAASTASRAPPQPIGFLRPVVVRALIEDNRKLVQMNIRPVWRFDPPIAFPPPARRPSYSSSRPGSRRGSRTALSALNAGETNSATPSEPGTPPNGGTDGLALESVLEGLRNLATGGKTTETGPWAVAFEDWVNEEGVDARREHIERVVRGWKMSGQFSECLGGALLSLSSLPAVRSSFPFAGWRDEEYTVWAPVEPLGENDNPLPGSNEAFRMERSACSLFGVATFGVHCNAYVEEEGKPLRLWVPRRSPTKQTWPSMLDNTVAGGITAGDTPRYSIIRECAEEASLPPSYVAPRIKQAGVITYNYRTDAGHLQPEVQYIYDLPLPPPEQEGALKPTTNPDDGEVESFELLDLEVVVQKMVDGEFKPNCALVLIDFFIRHGLLTFENDTRYLEIATRLHRPLVLPGPA
ncbi:hypothetical protein JCM10207_008268 [Rhodosporidiobolus poonsookiae]